MFSLILYDGIFRCPGRTKVSCKSLVRIHYAESDSNSKIDCWKINSFHPFSIHLQFPFAFLLLNFQICRMFSKNTFKAEAFFLLPAGWGIFDKVFLWCDLEMKVLPGSFLFFRVFLSFEGEIADYSPLLFRFYFYNLVVWSLPTLRIFRKLLGVALRYSENWNFCWSSKKYFFANSR